MKPPSIILSYKVQIVKRYAYKLQNVNIVIFFEKIKTGERYAISKNERNKRRSGFKAKRYC